MNTNSITGDFRRNQNKKKYKFKDLPSEVRDLMTELIRRCPFRTTVVQDWENLPISLTREEHGWLFVCQVCHETKCSGYIQDSQLVTNDCAVVS